MQSELVKIVCEAIFLVCSAQSVTQRLLVLSRGLRRNHSLSACTWITKLTYRASYLKEGIFDEVHLIGRAHCAHPYSLSISRAMAKEERRRRNCCYDLQSQKREQQFIQVHYVQRTTHTYSSQSTSSTPQDMPALIESKSIDAPL